MNLINNTNQFPEDSFIGNFLGKDYGDAVTSAEEWSQRTGAILLCYFEQKPIGKSHSILVGYRKQENQ